MNEADLFELESINRSLLGHMQALSAPNKQIADYGPAHLNIGPYEATQIDQQKQQAVEAQSHATL